MDPPPADALRQHRVRDVQRDDVPHRLAPAREHLVKHLRLLDRAREPVEDEPARAVLLLDAVFDDGDDEVVGDQAAGLHHGLGLNADLGARGDGGAKHVAGGELRDAHLGDDLRRLRAFPRPGRAEEDHDVLLPLGGGHRAPIRVNARLLVVDPVRPGHRAPRWTRGVREGDGARARPSDDARRRISHWSRSSLLLVAPGFGSRDPGVESRAGDGAAVPRFAEPSEKVGAGAHFAPRRSARTSVRQPHGGDGGRRSRRRGAAVLGRGGGAGATLLAPVREEHSQAPHPRPPPRALRRARLGDGCEDHEDGVRPRLPRSPPFSTSASSEPSRASGRRVPPFSLLARALAADDPGSPPRSRPPSRPPPPPPL